MNPARFNERLRNQRDEWEGDNSSLLGCALPSEAGDPQVMTRPLLAKAH